MTILLGIFDYQYRYQTDNMWVYCNFPGGVEDRVKWACEKATKIIMVLDGIIFPINPDRSMTCKEITIICENDEFFNKTTFILDGQVVQFDPKTFKPLL